jgi:hypothetical protein
MQIHLRWKQGQPCSMIPGSSRAVRLTHLSWKQSINGPQMAPPKWVKVNRACKGLWPARVHAEASPTARIPATKPKQVYWGHNTTSRGPVALPFLSCTATAACKLQRQVSFLIPKPRNRSLNVSSTLRSPVTEDCAGSATSAAIPLSNEDLSKAESPTLWELCPIDSVSHFLHLNFMHHFGVVFQGILHSVRGCLVGLPCGADVVGPTSVSKCIKKLQYGALGEIFHLSRFFLFFTFIFFCFFGANRESIARRVKYSATQKQPSGAGSGLNTPHARTMVKTLKLTICLFLKFWLQIWFQKYYISLNGTQFLINKHKNRGRFLFTFPGLVRAWGCPVKS